MSQYNEEDSERAGLAVFVSYFVILGLLAIVVIFGDAS